MTTERIQRCIHCRVEYTYQGSGWGDPQYNDAKYCGGCKEVISKALSQIPRRYECRYRNINELAFCKDITLEKVLQWEQEEVTQAWKEGRPLIKRIFFPLFDLENGDTFHSREVKGKSPFSFYRFKVSTWYKSPEYTIELPMEYDLVENKWTGAIW